LYPTSAQGCQQKYISSVKCKALAIYEGLDPAIFQRMGVATEGGGKARREAVKRLLEAVKNDLEICDREKIEKGIREEGFWRWAGRNAWNNMQSVREELDWATGQRKDSRRKGLGRAQSGGSGGKKSPDPKTEPYGVVCFPT